MTKRDLIRKHIGNWSGLSKTSIHSFADTGQVSGSFLIALENMMEEYHQSKLSQHDDMGSNSQSNIKAKVVNIDTNFGDINL